MRIFFLVFLLLAIAFQAAQAENTGFLTSEHTASRREASFHLRAKRGKDKKVAASMMSVMGKRQG